MNFAKWHGLGNDFVIVEADAARKINYAGMATAVCDRHFGIGADGLVTLRPLGGSAFEMRIYNSDGSESEMCGNATRCLGLYIAGRGLATGNRFELHTRAGIIRPEVVAPGIVRVDMGEPRFPEQVWSVTHSGEWRGSEVSMGNPHFVIPVDDMAAVRLEEWGPQIETDALFPEKSNVEFVETLSSDRLRMRVWERGCGVTLACGTGSCAAAVAGVRTGRSGREVTVVLDGGELGVEWSEADNHVYMRGPAVEVFTGVWPDAVEG